MGTGTGTTLNMIAPQNTKLERWPQWCILKLSMFNNQLLEEPTPIVRQIFQDETELRVLIKLYFTKGKLSEA